MTARLCVFGNSHAAALREAWIRNPGRWPQLHLDFMAAQKDHLLQTEVRDGRLVPTDPETEAAFRRISGISSIRLADYDGFIIAGAAICLNAVLPVYRDCQWVGLPSRGHTKDPARQAKLLISRAAAHATMQDILRSRLGAVLADRLRQNGQQPVFVTAQPRISAEILTAPRPVTRLHNIAIRNDDADTLGRDFDQAATGMLAGIGCTFIAQPARTVSHGVLTGLEFVKGAVRLTAGMDAPQPAADILHANGLYGALVLDQIAAALTL